MTARAGVAVADITPPLGGAMSGFAARREPALGVHDELTARAVAVSDGTGASLTVVADLVALTIGQAEELRTTIAAEAGIPADAVTVAVTHTHGGPQVTPDALGPPADPAAVERASTGIVAAALEAWRNQERTRIRHGSAVESTVARNRRDPHGPVDPTVRSIVFDDLYGRARVVLFSYACHPVALGADNRELTADWPGAARMTIERLLPGAVAVFLQGCCGQVNTGHSAHDSMRPTPSPQRTFAECDRIGTLVGRAAVEAVRAATPSSGPIRSATTTVELPFDELDVAELGLDVAAWEAERATVVELERRLVLDAKVDWARRYANQPRSPLRATVGAHRWGDVTVATLPGEPFVGLAYDITAGLERSGVLVAGYANGVPGYLPYPPGEYAAGGYEVDEAHCFYGQPQRFAPSCGSILVAAAVATAQSLHDSPPGR